MIKKVVVSFAVILGSTGAFAGGGNNVKDLTELWGGGKLSACGTNLISGTEACIGASQASGCKEKAIYARNYTDEWATQMMVALQVKEGGAYFCPVQVEGKNKNKKNAWTEYAMIGDSSRCVWLCRAGYSGAQCEQATGSDTASCDVMELKRNDYSNLKRVVSGANIEDSVAMFVWNQYYGCGVNKGQEHDMILAIKRYAPGGHGAWVQQMTVRAQREGWKHMISWAAIYPATGAQEQLVCKNGYKPNAALTDCVEINANVCAEAQACTGWTGFDETIHKFVKTTNQSCYEFRCKGDGMAFPSESDRTCSACETSMRGGVAPDTGVCVKCEAGTVFSTKAVNSGYCGSALGYVKTDLQYGKDKTKNTNPEPENQCWTQTETDVYKSCVENGGMQNVS